MNNQSSYCGLVDAKIRGSDKDLPVLDIIFWCLQVEIDSVEVTQDFEPDNELATALEKYSEKMEVELIKGQSL